MVHDLIIIGAGPAGITASVYAARKRLNFLVITKDIGGQTAWSGDIENYTGYQFITGPELTGKFQEHMKTYGVGLKEEAVVEVVKVNDLVRIKTDNSSYESKAVIIASGKRSRELGVTGEKEFKNQGLSYCATCDGPIFQGKHVAVIGGGNSALDAAIQLLRIASKIYIINTAAELTGDPLMEEQLKDRGSVVIMNNSQVTAIVGDKFVNGVKIRRNNKEEVLAVEGVFVEIGLMPNSGIAKDVEKNQKGEVKVTPFNETNIPGIFAAGDVTDVPEKQIIIAAGEGAKACLSAFRYIVRKR
jgi:alkyl hydroperoxide reductase subunit F